MIDQKEIICNIPERGLKDLEANYSIIEEKVHLFIPRKYDAPFNISHVFCKERLNDMYCQFLKCRTIGLGHDFDEYLVEEAYIGEDETSFKNDKYVKSKFFLTKDVLPFFDTPWELGNSFTDTDTRKLNFKSREDRHTTIKVNDNVTLIIGTGYSKSYSKVRYKATSSVGFTLLFKESISKTEIFDMINAIKDFYSLFCHKSPEISHIGFETDTLGIHYKGRRIVEDKDKDYLGNMLIENYQITESVENALIKWTNRYSKNRISLSLFNDAQNIKDEQLRFICLARCLELFHKENFIIPKPPLDYYPELHKFIIENSLSDIPADKFVNKKEITLAHRIYDLARSVFNNIKKDRLMFGHIINLNRCQKIVDTRNYYIHFSGTSEKKAWKPEDLAFTNFQLTIFTRVLFLKNLGFSDTTIKLVVVNAKGRFF